MSEQLVIQGDCLEQLKLLPSDSVDCVVTSPPYNLSANKVRIKWNGKYQSDAIDYSNDEMDEVEYQQWQVDVLNECFRVIKPTGSVFYNHKIRKGIHPWEITSKSKLKFHQQIVWDRCGSHFPAVHSLGQSTELIYWLVKQKPAVYKPKELIWRCEVWRQMPVQGKKRPNHPAPFPIEIPTNCILLTTKPGDLVLDCFAGSGTTLVAAKLLNRNAVGIEVSKKYCKVIEERLKDAELVS